MMSTPRSGNITQLEIAKRLGVHQTTVSAILSGNSTKKFSPAMRKRILSAAKRLGYRPFAPARILRGARSGLIGIFHFGRDKDVESKRLGEIIDAIHEAGYHPLAMPMDTKVMSLQKDEIPACSVMLDARVEGLILSGFADDFDLSQLERFRAAHIPIVSISGIKLPGIPLYAADREQAAYDATTHLIMEGRKKLLYLHRWSSDLTDLAKATAFAATKGFEKAAKKHGLKKSNAKIHTEPSTPKRNYYEAAGLAVHDALQKDPDLDAVLCYDDTWALSVYFYCQRVGISIPKDIAVVGFENQTISEHIYPTLTSSSQPHQEMASIAVKTLVDTLQNPIPELPDKIFLFPCKLIIRESSKGS